jgi:hypothetical protein
MQTNQIFAEKILENKKLDVLNHEHIKLYTFWFDCSLMKEKYFNQISKWRAKFPSLTLKTKKKKIIFICTKGVCITKEHPN